MTERLAALEETIGRLERWGSERDWSGPDPYDALNAPGWARMKRSRLGRRVLTQAVKRSPLDLRPVLRIEPQRDAATLGHLLSAYSRLDDVAGIDRDAAIGTILDWLRSMRIPDRRRPCWGYHFEVQTGLASYSSTTPNTIATAFVAHGLIDVAEQSGTHAADELAIGAGQFFLEDIGLTRTDAGAYFGYFPGYDKPIHNANLLACSVLARLAAMFDRTDFADAAREGVRHALAHQRPDGSWPYAEVPGNAWVDGFHTGYVLDSLYHCAAALEDSEAWDRYDRGLRFYDERLVEPDGTPRNNVERRYPIDAQSAAQAIHTFCLAAGRRNGSLDRAWRVHDLAVRTMLRPDGAFAYQRHRTFTNRIPHVRWVQAPMLAALSRLLRTAR